MTDQYDPLRNAPEQHLQRAEALRYEHWRLQSIIEGARVGTWQWNVQTGETVFNEMWAQILGYTLDELTPVSIKTWEAAVHPDDMKRSDALLARHFAGELPYYDCDCRMKHRDGHWIWIQDRGQVISRTADGKPLMMFGTHTDITDRKQAEAALRESEAKHKILFENANDAIFIVDMNARMLAVNPMAVRQLGYTHAELMSMTIYQVDSPDGGKRIQERIERLLEQGHLTFETEHLRKDGSVIPIEISARRISWDGQTAIMSICHDISERKIADETKKAALQEKEVLLREIHHRVKNNMQVISSLLFLQASRVENEQAQQALIESQQRIIAMAMIHETLYGSQTLAAIDLSAYLKRLVHHLQGVYSTQADIRLSLELGKVELDINQAVPCSLILNELITNAFKHAFPAGSQGTIRIQVHLISDREVFLEVSDNGKGLPKNLDLANPASLGLMLVQRLLKKQLKGSLEVAIAEGTTFSLRWPLPEVSSFPKRVSENN